MKLEPGAASIIHSKIRENTSLEKKCEIIDNNDIPTSVIHVKGLDYKEMKLMFVMNLFGNFGNVKKIIYFKDIGVALIEFTTKEFANEAINYLNDRNFFGSQLQVKYL